MHSSRHPSPLLRTSTLLLVVVALLTRAAAQTTVYWDTNGNAAGSSNAGGTWAQSSGSLWTASSAGTTATTTWNAVAAGDKIATFSAGTNATGTYSVTVSGTINNVAGLTFEEGNVTLNSSGGGGVLTLSGTPVINVATTQATIGAQLAGTAGFTKTGAGNLILTNANTGYSGTTVLSTGTLSLGNDSALGTGSLTINGGTLQASGGTRSIANDVAIGADFTIGGSNALTLSGTVNLGGATRTITVNNTATTTISGSITEPYYSGLTKAGSGELVLSGNNTFTAPVTVSAGTLTIASNNALGGTGTWGNTIASGAALNVTGNITVSEGGFTVSGTGVGGNGAIRNVSGTNSLGGDITLGAATTLASDAGTLTATGNVSVDYNLTATGAGNLTLAGSMYGSGGVTKSGTGTLTLSGSGANSFGGALAINDGTVVLAKTAGTNAVSGSSIAIGDGSGAAGSAVLRLGASNQIADYTGTITINSDGVLNLNNFSESVNVIAGTGRIDLGTTGSLTVGVNSGSSSFGGSILGTGTLIKGGAGTLTLLSSIVMAGELQLASGTLALNGFNLTAGTIHITGNSTIDFAGGNSTLSATTFIIDAGVTLTIQNWTDAADFFYTQAWTGATANTSGSAPMNQVTFSGYSSNATHWNSYDKQVTPVPEPATYGALLVSLLGGAVAWRRKRSRPQANPAAGNNL